MADGVDFAGMGGKDATIGKKETVPSQPSNMGKPSVDMTGSGGKDVTKTFNTKQVNTMENFGAATFKNKPARGSIDSPVSL